MSLRYIIDGYNIINHPLFARNHKKSQDVRLALLAFIRIHKPCGSPKNKISVVFDGYPAVAAGSTNSQEDMEVIYSKDQTADAAIKTMLERMQNPRIAVVVSDDKEIKFFARASGARPIGIEEFMKPVDGLIRKGKFKSGKDDLVKPELNYSQVSRINKELKNIWLK